MKRTFYLLYVVIVYPLLLVAQQKEPGTSTLLWRISSPKLKQSSYLYGTMHLQDKRLFHFTDSLYESIAAVEGFAGELDMNDMNELITDWIKNEAAEEQEQVLLKDISTAAQKKRYKAALEKRFKKKFELITLKELEDEGDEWSHSLRREDDMPTFVDAFLFGMARNQGKWTGALETIADQTDAPQPLDLDAIIEAALTDDKKRRAMMDEFISIYLSQDLSKMNQIVLKASGEYGNRKMNARNVNMVRKMDSLAAIRSCFYAVGAAHLPGDSGMIQLLRSKGYTVEPVFSDKKIEPDTYLTKLSANNWEQFNWANGDFTISMPGTSTSLDALGGFEHARIFFDPLSMSGFMCGYIPMANKTAAEIDSTCRLLPGIYATEGKVTHDSVWQINGRKGYEIKAITKDGFLNMMVNPVPGGIVMNMIISMSEAGLKMNNAATFFQSFVVNKKAGPPPVAGWRRMQVAPKQISFETPVELALTATKNDSSWITQTWSAMDPNTQVFYTVNIMETVPGLYSSLDSLYFEEIKGQYTENSTYRLLEHNYFKKDGFPGIAMKMGTKLGNDSIHYLFSVINRGNRRYAYLVGYYPSLQNSVDANRFMKGIQLLPYISTATLKGEVPYENFSLFSPALYKTDTSEVLEQGVSRFVMYDSSSAVTMHVQKEPLNKYYRAATDSIFLRSSMDYFKTEMDSLIRFEMSSIDGIPAAQGWISLEGTHNIKRVKLMASGDTLYSLAGVLSPEVAGSAAYTQMFESFRVQEFSSNSYTQSKARKLFQDLLLPDSLVFSEAKEAVKWVDITKEDLPSLHAALLNPLIDFSDRSACTHDELMKRVLEMKDTSTFGFIQQAYPELTDRNAVLQYPLLALLAGFQTQQSYELIASLLESGRPKAGNPGILYTAMTDSMELARQLFPVVKKYKQDSLLRKILPGFTLDMRTVVQQPGSLLEELRPVFLELADEYMLTLENKDLPLPIHFEELLELLTIYEEPAFSERLKKLSYHPNEDVQYSTVKLLLAQKKTVPQDLINKIAADPFYRSTIYDKLKDAGQLKKFPKAFASQTEIAASLLFREIWYGTESYQLKWLKTHTLKMDGKKQYFFLYKVTFNTEEGVENYLGVAGPYLSKNRIDTTPGELLGVYYEEELDESRLEEQLEAFIQSQQ